MNKLIYLHNNYIKLALDRYLEDGETRDLRSPFAKNKLAVINSDLLTQAEICFIPHCVFKRIVILFYFIYLFIFHLFLLVGG